MRTSAFLMAALLVCGAAHGGNHRADRYLDIIEAAVAAYSDEHAARYLAAVEREGVSEHGFPRLAANLGVLIANGRRLRQRGMLKRMMDLSCRDAAKGRMPPKSGGNDFSVKELVLAVAALEKSAVFPKATTDAWRRTLTAVKAEDSYTFGRLAVGGNRAYNWVVFACASEQARLAAGMGGDPAYVERYVADQLRWFDENGMYRDPNQPIVYDLVTRLQFAFILAKGYDGPSRARLLAELEKSGDLTLEMLSAAGEIPYGGRSNQFLHNHTFYAALCEWYAAHCRSTGDVAKAARFTAAADRALDALDEWLKVRPVRHVKNFYPPESGIGCEGYAYFDKYMVTMGSWALLARELADDVLPSPRGMHVPAASAPRETRLSPAFHQILLAAGDYSAQITYDADEHYDANGIGRLQRRGAPAAICLSTPCTATPQYRITGRNTGPLSMAPYTSARLTAGGLSLVREEPGEVAIDLPAFVFDGETEIVPRAAANVLEVAYRGWVCRYETDGAIRSAGRTAENRNGRYAVFQAVGTDRVSVRVTIERLSIPESATIPKKRFTTPEGI